MSRCRGAFTFLPGVQKEDGDQETALGKKYGTDVVRSTGLLS